MGPDMDHHIGLPDVVEIVHLGHELVRRGTYRVLEYLAYLAVAPRPVAAPLRLQSYDDISQPDSGDQDLPVQDHALAWRLSPGLHDVLRNSIRKRSQIRLVLVGPHLV